MSTLLPKLLVLVGKGFRLCENIRVAPISRSAPISRCCSPGWRRKAYVHFIIDLSEWCAHGQHILGVLAGFGLKNGPADASNQRGIELFNPNARITELLEIWARCISSKSSPARWNWPGHVETHTPESHPSNARAKSRAPVSKRTRRS